MHELVLLIVALTQTHFEILWDTLNWLVPAEKRLGSRPWQHAFRLAEGRKRTSHVAGWCLLSCCFLDKSIISKGYYGFFHANLECFAVWSGLKVEIVAWSQTVGWTPIHGQFDKKDKLVIWVLNNMLKRQRIIRKCCEVHEVCLQACLRHLDGMLYHHYVFGCILYI